METKLLEIRDIGTHIPALAVSLSEKDGYPAVRASFVGNYILLTKLTSLETQYVWNKWNTENGRTMRYAHKYILENWDNIKNEDVIDVRFILGEVNYICKSEKP